MIYKQTIQNLEKKHNELQRHLRLTKDKLLDTEKGISKQKELVTSLKERLEQIQKTVNHLKSEQKIDG